MYEKSICYTSLRMCNARFILCLWNRICSLATHGQLCHFHIQTCNKQIVSAFTCSLPNRSRSAPASQVDAQSGETQTHDHRTDRRKSAIAQSALPFEKIVCYPIYRKQKPCLGDRVNTCYDGGNNQFSLIIILHTKLFL